MLKIIVSFFSISTEFTQTFVLSVSKCLNAEGKERCWLLSMPLKTTDCTLVYDTNFCLSSIFLHQTWTVRFV